jgi:hypothetical protein
LLESRPAPYRLFGRKDKVQRRVMAAQDRLLHVLIRVGRRRGKQARKAFRPEHVGEHRKGAHDETAHRESNNCIAIPRELKCRVVSLIAREQVGKTGKPR